MSFTVPKGLALVTVCVYVQAVILRTAGFMVMLL